MKFRPAVTSASTEAASRRCLRFALGLWKSFSITSGPFGDFCEAQSLAVGSRDPLLTFTLKV